MIIIITCPNPGMYVYQTQILVSKFNLREIMQIVKCSLETLFACIKMTNYFRFLTNVCGNICMTNWAEIPVLQAQLHVPGDIMKSRSSWKPCFLRGTVSDTITCLLKELSCSMFSCQF